MLFIKFIYLLATISFVNCWDAEEMEIFDLVEEINQNFYEVMGIKQDATGQEVKRAFRNLSIILHPDKNDAEDANVVFRNLVSIYEVLKDSSKREKYDKVLKDGLPNWKSALYYYRRVRKMGLAEMAAILFVIITIGQYFVSWAAYIEKKYTAEQLFGSKLKKLQKKNKTNVDIDSILNEIPAPSVFNTLPFQIPKAIWNIPRALKNVFETFSEYKRQELEKKKREAEEYEQQKLLEEEIAKEKEAKKEKKESMRKRKQANVAPEKTEEDLAGYSQLRVRDSVGNSIRPVTQAKVAQMSGGFWSDEDLTELIRLVKKYPGGTTDRWEIIADSMDRSVTEVTFMAAKLKENGYRLPGQAECSNDNIINESGAVKKIKVKKTANPILITETNWSQEQQQALEAAIVKYPKTGTIDRWLKISNCIPGKTKEECLVRYKYLVELVKSQKGIKNKEDDETNMILDNQISLEQPADVVSNDSYLEEEPDHIEKESIVNNKGKPRNKRKERKKRMEFSSEEEDESN